MKTNRRFTTDTAVRAPTLKLRMQKWHLMFCRFIYGEDSLCLTYNCKYLVEEYLGITVIKSSKNYYSLANF